MGFRGFEQNSQGVYVKSAIHQARVTEVVHFPEDAYSQEWMRHDSVWSFARLKLIKRCLDKYGITILWEIGAGNGLVAIPLQNYGITVIASDPLYSGMKRTSECGVLSFHGRFEELNLPTKSISAIGVFDVLEHIEHPESFLNGLYNVMQEDGLLFVTVPAIRWLYSDFDEAVGHFRRYTRKEIDKVLVRSGFSRVDSRYFFFSLVVPALILRRIPYLLGRRKSFQSNSGILSKTIFQTKILSWFSFVLRPLLVADTYFKLPLGLSIIGVYRKEKSNS